MKKMKKMIAVLASTLVALLPIFVSAMPVGAVAATTTISEDLEWYDWDTEEYFATTTATVISFDSDIEIWDCDAGRETDSDGLWYWAYIESYFDYCEGDTVIINLPFSTSYIDMDSFYYYYNEWSAPVFSGNSITFTCVEETDECYFEFTVSGEVASAAPQNDFWFIPMKTQLNIAAEIASTSGKEAVAEVSGDFGLSYEIMKYLDDHPGVTLKYTLTYKGEEHLIVIPGGGKFANPEIPWYGPEYLIGNFGK